MSDKKIIIGNWKMNPLTLKEAEKLWNAAVKNTPSARNAEIIICPPFLYLEKLRFAGRRTRKISLGAQDAFWGETGAFTGEVSGDMLYLLGAKYVILGHSERRNPSIGTGETNEIINKKIKSALAAGLRPILCVGERERDEDHGYFNLVKEELEECLKRISKNSIDKLIIAYEPIWAISSTLDRRNATAEDSNEMAIFIRKIMTDKFGKDAAKVKIVYGGSVNERDAEEFLKNGGVDGLLVGRASLNAEKFAKIINIAARM